jgi:hypothetical protein
MRRCSSLLKASRLAWIAARGSLTKSAIFDAGGGVLGCCFFALEHGMEQDSARGASAFC